MQELNDYSGEFNPNLRFEDFSKEFLIRYIRELMAEYLKLIENYHNTVEEMFGTEAATKCEIAAVCKQERAVAPRIARLANIQLPVKDVVEAMKIMQLVPDNATSDIFKADWDFKGQNCVIWTTTHCATLGWLEKNAPSRVKTVCQIEEPPMAEAYMHALNPNFQVKPLKLPPRKSPNEIACQWEFKLEP